MNKISHLTFWNSNFEFEVDLRIRIRSPPSLSTIQYHWWIAMSALLLHAAMCVPMYLFEHHLACDLVRLRDNQGSFWHQKLDPKFGFQLICGH